MLEAALAYAEVGLPVFPVVSGGKAPLTPHGFRDATVNPATITAWWTRWPKVNIAMPTGPWSGWDVLDIDVSPDGSHGLAEVDDHEIRDLQQRRSHVVHTPSGGEHWYYPASGCGNGSIPGKHLDYRGHGGYVLVPPSTIVYDDGASAHYRLVEQPRPPDKTDPMDWSALRRCLIPPPLNIWLPGSPPVSDMSADQRLLHLVRHVLSTTEGNRNNALFWAACRAVENGTGNLDPLVDAAVQTGLSEQEARRTCTSARRATRPGGPAAAASPAGESTTYPAPTR